MALVDPVAQRPCRDGELDPRVDALGLGGVRRHVDGDPPAALDDPPYRIREIELALCVRGREGVERGPQRLGPEDVDGRVRLAQVELLRRGVGCLDDRHETAVVTPDDPAVAADVGGDEREDGRSRCPVAVRGEQLGQERGREQRRVAGQHEHLVGAGERPARRADSVPRPERLLLDRHLHVRERLRGVGRGDDDQRRRVERTGGLEHPVDHAPPEQRVQVLGELGTHPRPEPSGHHDCGETRRHQGVDQA